MATIDEVRRSGRAGLPRATYPLCLLGALNADLQEAKAAYDDAVEAASLLTEPSTPSDDESRTQSGRTYGSPVTDDEAAIQAAWDEGQKKVKAAAAHRDELVAEMQEHLTPVLLTAKKPGEWMDWEAAHPARDGENDDEKYGFDFAALINALPDHIVDVGGAALEPPTYDDKGELVDAGDWAFVTENASLGDLREMAGLVARLQFGRVAAPKA